MKKILLISGVLVAVVSTATAAPSVSRGKQTYMRVGCYQCHGTEGQGSGAGLPLSVDPLPAEAISNYIRGATLAMPPYPEVVLSDDEIADIAAFIASVKRSPTVDQIPILRDLKVRK